MTSSGLMSKMMSGAEGLHYFDGISALAIDLVGTLVCKPTPHFYGVASEFLAKHGTQVSNDEFRRIFRRRYWEHSMGNYETDSEFYAALLADLSRTYDPALEVLTDLYLEASAGFPEVGPFLDTMSRRYRLVLASNYVGPWAARILESHGWLPYFHGCVVSSDCGFCKPSRQFFRELLNITGASSSEVLMIGDSVVNDVYGARAAGIRAVLLDRKATLDGRRVGEDVLSSLNELAARLAPESSVSRGR